MQLSTKQSFYSVSANVLRTYPFTLAVVAEANPVPHPHAATSAVPSPTIEEDPVVCHL